MELNGEFPQIPNDPFDEEPYFDDQYFDDLYYRNLFKYAPNNFKPYKCNSLD